MKSSGMTYQSV